MAPKAVSARRHLDRNHRFRGHGPLLQERDHSHGDWRIHRGIYKGSSPCWYDVRPSRRGPPAREAGMARSYRSVTISTAIGASTGDLQGVLPLLVRRAAEPPRASGPRGGHGPLLQERDHSHGDWRIHGGSTWGPPLVGTTCGRAAAGLRPERRAWPATTGITPASTVSSASTGGSTRGPPLVGTTCGRAAAGVRPERRP